MTITALPAAPSRSDTPANFITKADAFLAALAQFVTEVNAAAAAFDVTEWVSGTTYAVGDRVWSPVNYRIFMRKVAGAGTTDPSADTTNWADIDASRNSFFSAYLSATASNQTGDGTAYTVICDTEIKDKGSDYNSTTGVFTAPAAGTYQFNASVYFTGFAASGGLAQMVVKVVTTSREFSQTVMVDRNGIDFTVDVTAVEYMTAGQTAYIVAVANNAGGKTVDILGHGTNAITRFSGHLIG